MVNEWSCTLKVWHEQSPPKVPTLWSGTVQPMLPNFFWENSERVSKSHLGIHCVWFPICALFICILFFNLRPLFFFKLLPPIVLRLLASHFWWKLRSEHFMPNIAWSRMGEMGWVLTLLSAVDAPFPSSRGCTGGWWTFAVLLVPAPPQAPLAPLGLDYLRKDGIPINFLLYRYIGTLNAQLYQKYLFPKLVSAGRRHIYC